MLFVVRWEACICSSSVELQLVAEACGALEQVSGLRLQALGDSSFLLSRCIQQKGTLWGPKSQLT